MSRAFRQLRRGPRVDRAPAARPGLVALGAVALLCAAALIYVAFRAPAKPPGRSVTTIRVHLRDLANLPPRGAEVRLAGRLVGQTLDARLEKGRPTVDLQLRADAPRIPVDSTVRVRLRSLVGAQFVDLVPGLSSRYLRDGGTIPVGRTSAAVPIGDVLATFDAPTRQASGSLLRGLGAGLAGRGTAVSGMLAAGPVVLRDISTTLEPLLSRGDVVTRFVDGAARFAGSLDPVREDLALLFGEGADALDPFAAETASVDRLLQVAPGALAATRAGLARSDALLVEARAFADTTTRFTADAPMALRSVTDVLHDGRRPLAELTTVADRLRRAIPPTLTATDGLRPVLPRLTSTLALSRGPVRTLGEYDCDLRGFFKNWRSFLSYAPPGQDGPLGPQTVLRVLAGDTLPLPANARGRRQAYPAPCSAHNAEGQP